MSRAYQEDPLKVWQFVVEVDGFARAGFMECTGLERTTEVAEYREGGQNSTAQKSAGQSTFSNITLKRGQIVALPGADDFYNWASDVHEAGGIGVSAQYRRDFDIVQYDASGVVEVARWNIINSFPIRFKPFGDLNAMEKSGNSIEELEIAHEGFSKV